MVKIMTLISKHRLSMMIQVQDSLKRHKGNKNSMGMQAKIPKPTISTSMKAQQLKTYHHPQL